MGKGTQQSFATQKGHQSNRNAGIDLLRGIAIVLVITHHLGLRLPLNKSLLTSFAPKWVLSTLNWRGYHAVFLFFVISGFLIARNSLNRWERLSRIQPLVFYRRRAARILPCLFALLAVLSVLHLLHLRDFTIKVPGQSLGHALFSALGLHLNWYEGITGYLPANWDVLWSLSIEECFYLAFPVLCLLLRRDFLLSPLLVLLAAALPWFLTHTGGSEIWQEKAYLPGFSAIATGVLAAMVTRWFSHVKPAVYRTLCAVGTLGLFGVFCMPKYLWPVFGEGSILFLTFCAACLLLAFHWQRQTGQAWTLPGTGWLQSCGRLSYEIYLTHMFIVLPAVLLYDSYGWSERWSALVYLPLVMLCWLLGWLVSCFFSNPADRWALEQLWPKSSAHESLKTADIPVAEIAARFGIACSTLYRIILKPAALLAKNQPRDRL